MQQHQDVRIQILRIQIVCQTDLPIVLRQNWPLHSVQGALLLLHLAGQFRLQRETGRPDRFEVRQQYVRQSALSGDQLLDLAADRLSGLV